MSKQSALEGLLKSMFHDVGLRSFLGQMPDGGPLLAELPGGAASLLEVMSETIRILERHGIIDGEFFAALAVERPRRRKEIHEVAEMWGLTLPPALAAPPVPPSAASPTSVIAEPRTTTSITTVVGQSTPSMRVVYGELEIELHRTQAGGFEVTLRLKDPQSQGEVAPVRGPVVFNLQALLASQVAPEEYGRLLAAQLFADAAVRGLYARARSALEGGGLMLRVRVAIDDTAAELHAVRWELLRDPETGVSLATSERVLLSRFMSSPDFRRIELVPRARLRAVIAVSAPSNVADYSLTPVDLDGEVARATAALAGVDVTVVGQAQPLTLDRFVDALRTSADIVYLVCHGTLTTQFEPVLFLQNEAGAVAPVKGKELAVRVGELLRTPRLMVLASCESAGSEGASAAAGERTTAQASLAPRLVTAGVPAVLAMQGRISSETVQRAMPRFFQELLADGQIDRALAVARGFVRTRLDYWMPALFLRLKDGRMWSDPAREQPSPSGEPASGRLSGEPATSAGMGDPHEPKESEHYRPWSDAERQEFETTLITLLRDAPALSRCLEKRLARRTPAPVGPLPDDVHARVARRIVALGKGCPAALVLAEECCTAVVGERADARGEQREARKLLEHWMPRGYGGEARVLLLTLSSPSSSEPAGPGARHIEVGTLSPFIAEVHVAGIHGRDAAFATRTSFVDGKRRRLVEGRARFPTRSAGSEILTGDGIARAIVRSAFKRYLLEATTSDAMAMLNVVTELETQMELTGLRHYVVFTGKERRDELFAEVIERLGELFPDLQVVALADEPGALADIPQHIRRETKLLTYLRRIFEDHGIDDDDL